MDKPIINYHTVYIHLYSVGKDTFSSQEGRNEQARRLELKKIKTKKLHTVSLERQIFIQNCNFRFANLRPSFETYQVQSKLHIICTTNTK